MKLHPRIHTTNTHRTEKSRPSVHRQLMAVAFCGMLSIVTTASQGQRLSTASIQVTATIPPSISLVADRNLNIGVLRPGVTETIDPVHSNAGRVVLTGPPGTSVYVTFSLPTCLVAGQDTLPIRFGRNSARISSDAASAEDGTLFDPANGFVAKIGDGTNGVAGEMYLSLGCTVQPRRDQKSGDYSGEVRMTVIYTGE